MARVELSTLADADLEAIYEYSAGQFGRDVALAYADSLRDTIALLEHGEIDPPIFSLPSRSHRVYYDLEGDRVIVQRILHKAMDPKKWLR